MSPLTRAARAVLEQVPAQLTDPEAIATFTVPQVRELAGMTETVDRLPLPIGIEAEDIVLDGPASTLAGRVYRPSFGTRPGTILWIRGGGFCALDHLDRDRVSPLLARESGSAVVTFDYRTAPEHPFPAAADDAFAALRWVAANYKALGSGSKRLAVGGDSAGGNLAAAATLMAREHGGPEIARQVLLYPMTARHFDGLSRHDPSCGALAHPDLIEWLWRQYVKAGDDCNPLASPLDAASLAGLPPALVITAEYDVLRDEGEAYAARLARESVPVQSRRWDGVFHGFVEWPIDIPEAAECLREIGLAFSDGLAKGS